MKGKPGAWVELEDGRVVPDAGDEAMRQRLHTGEETKKKRKGVEIVESLNR